MIHFSRRELLVAGLATLGMRRLAAAAEPSQEVTWLADVQRAPALLPAGSPRLTPLLDASDMDRSEVRQRWMRRREELRRWWLDFLGPMEVVRPAAPRFDAVAEDREAGVIRQRIRYEVEPGVPTEAYLLKPLPVAGRRPGVVVLHSTTPDTIRQPAGLAGTPEKHLGLKLAQRGMVAICPQCFLWSGDPKISYQEQVARFNTRHLHAKGMAKMLFDAQVALDLLAGMAEVDAGRLGAVGHSLGAKETLYLAALDERIIAAVSSEGGIGTRYSNWEASWYLGPSILAADFAHEHHELLALVAPRAFLLLGGDSADGDRSWPFIESALPIYRLDREPPRLGLFNHRQGHAVPPEAERRIYEWLETYL